jgi:hypothetical protein
MKPSLSRAFIDCDPTGTRETPREDRVTPILRLHACIGRRLVAVTGRLLGDDGSTRSVTTLFAKRFPPLALNGSCTVTQFQLYATIRDDVGHISPQQFDLTDSEFKRCCTTTCIVVADGQVSWRLQVCVAGRQLALGWYSRTQTKRTFLMYTEKGSGLKEEVSWNVKRPRSMSSSCVT